ncbi:MAG TPA: zinc-binding dehydrogenase, partial [Myxococcales bacterium]|nr:zinc-binding dehydrogenase [Myxococcales bacterium]
GADDTIDYEKADLRQRILDLTGGKGADVVYDPVGGAQTEAALRATAWGGRLLVIGFASGVIPRVKLNLALLKEGPWWACIGGNGRSTIRRDSGGTSSSWLDGSRRRGSSPR